MLVSVAIPVFRNAESLIELHERIVAAVAAIPDATYEIIFTDDGSDDRSLEVLREIHENDPNVIVVALSRNFGQHAANAAAFQHASGDIVVNMSADLQDPPELITRMVGLIEEGNDIVLAVRAKVNEAPFKRLTSWLHYRLVRISVPQFPSGGFDFWAVNGKAFKAFLSFDDINRRNQIDLMSFGYKVAEIPYEKARRKFGKSHYGFIKRLDISLSRIFSTATWPMRLASLFGLAFTLLATLVALFMIATYQVRTPLQVGWTSIIVLILLVGVINSLMIGLMGEYIWRIYYETKHRPVFFVDRVFGKNRLANPDGNRSHKKMSRGTRMRADMDRAGGHGTQ